MTNPTIHTFHIGSFSIDVEDHTGTLYDNKHRINDIFNAILIGKKTIPLCWSMSYIKTIVPGMELLVLYPLDNNGCIIENMGIHLSENPNIDCTNIDDNILDWIIQHFTNPDNGISVDIETHGLEYLVIVWDNVHNYSFNFYMNHHDLHARLKKALECN